MEHAEPSRRIIHVGAFPKSPFCDDKVGEDRTTLVGNGVSLDAHINAPNCGNILYPAQKRDIRRPQLPDRGTARYRQTTSISSRERIH